MQCSAMAFLRTTEKCVNIRNLEYFSSVSIVTLLKILDFNCVQLYYNKYSHRDSDINFLLPKINQT
jgi:hypothetical protein